MIHVINLFFYGEHDGNIFVLIWRHQDGLERRKGHPGGVQQENLWFPLWTCDTYCNPIFLWRKQWKYFYLDLASQVGLERREGHPGGVQQEKLMFPLSTCDTCYNPIFL